MAATGAIAAIGTLLKRGDGGSPEAFTTVLEVMKLKAPQIKIDVVDVTNDDSPGAWEEKIPTILRSGEVTFTVNYQPASTSHNATAGILADVSAKTKRNWKIVFPNSGATTWSFSAYVTGFQPDADESKQLTADITLTITGQPTLA